MRLAHTMIRVRDVARYSCLGKWSGGLVVVVLLVAVVLGAEQSFGQEPERVVVKVAKVLEDGRFVAQWKGRKVEVAPAATCQRLRCERVPMRACASGEPVALVARLMDPVQDPTTMRTLPAEYVNLLALVVGAGFKPPALVRGWIGKRVKWHTGVLNVKAAHLFQVGETTIQIGPDRPVLRCVTESEPVKPVKVGQTLWLDGKWRAERGRSPFVPSVLLVLPKRLSAAERSGVFVDAR